MSTNAAPCTLPGVPKNAVPMQQILSVLDALPISLPQGPHKEAKTGPAEAGSGELLGRVNLEQCLLPEHKTPAHR